MRLRAGCRRAGGGTRWNATVVAALVVCVLLALAVFELRPKATIEMIGPGTPTSSPVSHTGDEVTVYARDAPIVPGRPGPICEGENDQDQINLELAAAGNQGGGTVRLSSGQFFCSGDLIVASNVHLAGAGREETRIEFDDVGDVHLLGPGGYVEDFSVAGPALVLVTADRCTVRNISATTGAGRWATFGVQVPSSRETIRGVSFIDCSAVDCGTNGFMITANEASSTVLDTTYLRCTVLNAGAKSRFNDWVVGFSLPEKGNVRNISVVQCRAEGCWESGFHAESEPEKIGVQLTDCTSVRNGQRRQLGGVEPDYGAGFVVSGDMFLSRCHSAANEIGFLCVDGGSLVKDCDDTGSGTGILIKNIVDPSGLKIENTQIANAKIPILIASTGDEPFTLISLNSLTITGEKAGAGAAVVIREVPNLGKISISDSTIEGYPSGLTDSEEGPIARRNVTVDGLALDTA